jgi:hypothetical protein
MPIWLRNTTYNFILEHHQKQQQQYASKDKNQKIDFNDLNNAKKVYNQNTKNTYVTKASKK